MFPTDEEDYEEPIGTCSNCGCDIYGHLGELCDHCLCDSECDDESESRDE